MKGLDLSKEFYKAFGEKMIAEKFPETVQYIAVGLAGSGSQCCGYDDELSRDHDFEPEFCIFIPDEDKVSEKTAFLLQKEYEKLPKEFMGFHRTAVAPTGGRRNGVFRISEFFGKTIGSRNGELTSEMWLSLPQYALCEATNGEIFFDGYGELTRIRENLSSYPRDIKLKKLSGNLVLMGQSGEYNFPRLLKRGDTAGAQLALFEFVNHATECAFLINNRYMPYYKWRFRALRELPRLSDLGDKCEFLISTDNSPENAEIKEEIIREIGEETIKELVNDGLLTEKYQSLEEQGYRLNEKIKAVSIRNANILIGV